MKKVEKLINKDMMISELVEKYPDLAMVLVEDYGFHCIGCFASGMETLEQGAMVHGMEEEDIKVMIENLNELLMSEKKLEKSKTGN
jgi:hybrid cluster-associated redox disulfide protein